MIVLWIGLGIIMGAILCWFGFLFMISMYGPFAEYTPDNKTLLPFWVRFRHFIFGRPH